MAALHVSRDHWLAMRHVRHDAVRHSILSRSLPCCVEMESTRVRSSVRRDGVRSLRVHNARNGCTAFARCLWARTKEMRARNCDRRASVELELSPNSLAQFLAARMRCSRGRRPRLAELAAQQTAAVSARG